MGELTKSEKDFLIAMGFGDLLDLVKTYIAKNYEPEDIFPEKQLEAWALIWAENNGYVKE